MRDIKRTLVAVGVAALASMLLAPHEDAWNWGNNHFDWAHQSQAHYFPIFFYDPPYYSRASNPIRWTEFFGRTAFLAVLAALAANIPWRRKLKQTGVQPGNESTTPKKLLFKWNYEQGETPEQFAARVVRETLKRNLKRGPFKPPPQSPN